MKKCRNCQKTLKPKNTAKEQKRLGLCEKCFAWDKKWVKQGIKFSNIKETLFR